jgi:uncharacterized membrane protein YhhN
MYNNRSVTLLYVLVGIAVLIANFFTETLPAFQYAVKPLIMVVLSVYFFRAASGRRTTHVWVMQAALFFSWLGDIFLMFQGELFFLLGLASFLLTHIGYAWVFGFTGPGSSGRSLLARSPWIGLIYLGYGLVLFRLIFPGLGDMTVPVIVYAAAIITMVILAVNRWERVPAQSFSWVLLGALCFMFSDSLIAINKFSGSVPFARTWIMALYMTGQYLIVRGYLEQVKMLPKRR